MSGFADLDQVVSIKRQLISWAEVSHWLVEGFSHERSVVAGSLLSINS